MRRQRLQKFDPSALRQLNVPDIQREQASDPPLQRGRKLYCWMKASTAQLPKQDTEQHLCDFVRTIHPSEQPTKRV